MTKTYEAIAKAIYSGQARGLNQQGIQISNFERELMPKFALMGSFNPKYYDENIRIVLNALQMFSGQMAKYLRSTQGQIDLATAHIKMRMRMIWKEFGPIQDQVTLLQDKFVTLITPSIMTAFKYVNVWLKDLNKWMAANMDTMKKWISEGWKKLFEGISWFQANSDWLVPWIKKVSLGIVAWTFVIGPLITAIGSLSWAMVGLLAVNPWMALASAAMIAAGLIITNWTQVKKWFMDFYEWMVGTRMFNQTMEPKGVLRGHAPGAMFEQGWMANLKHFFDTEWGTLWVKAGTIANKFFGEGSILANWSEDIRKWEEDQFPKWGDAVSTWFKNTWKGLVTWMIPNVWGAMIDGLMKVTDALNEFLIDPFHNLKQMWDDFVQGITNPKATPSYPTTPGSPIPSRLPGPGGTAATSGQAALLGGTQRTWSPMDSLWGRVDPHGTMYTHFGYPSDETWDSASGIGQGAWVKAMIPNYDVALNNEEVALLRRMGINPEPGKPFTYDGVTYRYGDQVPEYYRGHKIKGARLDIFDPGYGPDYKGRPRVRERAIPGNVTINNNVNYHIHGGDIEHKLAEQHRRHIEQMKKDLAEAHYKLNRSSFVSGGSIA